MHKNTVSEKLDIILLTLLFAVITAFPLIKITETFYIGAEEILIPVILLRILFLKMYFFNKYIGLLLIFMTYIFFTIIINGRWSSLRDYFEIYKFFKFILVIYYGCFVLKNHFDKITNVVYPIFIFLCLFNLAHYFDFFNFNSTIEPFYAVNPIQLEFFGLDSLGNVAVRRMLGTMGNPNNNAILLLFFFAFFLNRKKENVWALDNIFLYVSFFSILLTQSRTGFLALFAVYILWAFLTKPKLKILSIDIFIFASCFLAAFFFDALALNYFSNTVDALDDAGGLYQNRSVMGRIEVWQHLMGMIKHKFMFGHGPNKDYFYQNGLYAESEYVLYVWRYGIVGIILYLGWVLGSFYKNIKLIKKDLYFLMVVVIVLVNAISNCPLTNPRILILFGLAVSYWLAFVEKQNVRV